MRADRQTDRQTDKQIYSTLITSESKGHTAKLYQILYACCLWPWFSFLLTALGYVMYFRFVDDVMLSYHETDGPEASTTLLFRSYRQVTVYQLDARQLQ